MTKVLGDVGRQTFSAILSLSGYVSLSFIIASIGYIVVAPPPSKIIQNRPLDLANMHTNLLEYFSNADFELAPALLLFSASFSLLWIRYLSERRRPNARSAMAIQFLVLTVSVLLIFFLSGLPKPSPQSFRSFLFVCLPSLVFAVIIVYRSYQNKTLGDIDSHWDRHEFLTRIFTPAVIFCTTSLTIGGAAHTGLPWTQPGSKAEEMYEVLAIWGFGAYVTLLVALRIRLQKILFTLMLLFGISFYLAVGSASQLGETLSIVLALTLAVGVAEVAKEARHMGGNVGAINSTSQLLETDFDWKFLRDTPLGYYLAGSNWAFSVFPVFSIAITLFFGAFELFFTFLVSAIFSILWLSLDERVKTSSKWSYIGATAYGFLLPLSVLGGVFYSDHPNASGGSEDAGRALLAMLAMIGFSAGLLRLSKDALGLSLHSFFLQIWDSRIYRFRPYCLYLLLTTNVLVKSSLALLLIFLSWRAPLAGVSIAAGGQGADLTGKMMGASFFLTMLSIGAILSMFWRPSKTLSLRGELAILEQVQGKDGMLRNPVDEEVSQLK